MRISTSIFVFINKYELKMFNSYRKSWFVEIPTLGTFSENLW